MSKRTNEEIMALHEAGKPVPKSDDARLRHLIQAAYANQRAESARQMLSNTAKGNLNMKHALQAAHNVVALIPRGHRPSTRLVRLLHLDGTEFAEAGFLPGLASAPWEWIVETVAAELECDPESVGCMEAEEGGGDFVTVDGLPVYRVALPRAPAAPLVHGGENS